MNRIIVAFLSIWIVCPAHGAFFSKKNWEYHLARWCDSTQKYEAAMEKVIEFRKQDANFTKGQLQAVFHKCGTKAWNNQKTLLQQLNDYQRCKPKSYTVKGNPNPTYETCINVCKNEAQKIGCTQTGIINRGNNGICRCNQQAYWAVCDGKTSGDPSNNHCVKDVFSDTSVQMLQAVGLAKEYARIKHGVTDLTCDEKHRTTLLIDDYIKCTSIQKAKFYEFKFNSVTRSIDANIRDTLSNAIAKLYNTTVKFMGNKSYQYQTNCANISQALFKFGYVSTPQSATTCLATPKQYNPSQSNPCGVNQQKFYKGIQVRVQTEIIKKIQEHVTNQCKAHSTNIATFECDANPVQVPNINGGYDNDDVLFCYVNNKGMQLVFDDLSELVPALDRAGRQGMDCIIAGGTYNGKKCMHLTEQQCQAMQNNLTRCSDCEQPKWNEKEQICELPSSATGTDLTRWSGVGITAAGAALTVAAVVLSGGTVALVIVAAGAGVASTAADIYITGAAQRFFEQTATCNNTTCANRILTESMKEIINSGNDFTAQEVTAADSEIERLANLLAQACNNDKAIAGKAAAREGDSCSMYRAIVANKDKYTNAGLFSKDAWTTPQLIRAFGDAIQIATSLASVTKLGSQLSNFKWPKTTKAIQKIANTSQKASKVVSRADTATNVLDAAANASVNNIPQAGNAALSTSSGQIENLIKAGTRVLK